MKGEDCVCVESRKYVGNGKLEFEHGNAIECNFEFEFRFDGRSNFECIFYLSNENTEFVLYNLKSTSVVYGSFVGVDSLKGKFTILRMGLDVKTISEASVRGIPNPQERILKKSILLKVLSQLNAEAYYPWFVKSIFIARMRFLINSPVQISYAKLVPSDKVTSVSGITNFQFGMIEDSFRIPNSNINEFDIQIK